MPHGKVFPDISAHIRLLENSGYGVRCVVMHRDFFAQAHSQVAAGHVTCIEQAHLHIRLAYERIYAALAETRCWYVPVTYEALVHYPQRMMNWLLPELGLPVITLPEVITDENEKWYAPLLGIHVPK